MIDSIGYSSLFLYRIIFDNCENGASFITGKNINSELFHDLEFQFIIADFNFDHQEDLAIISDCGNAITSYNFYIQDSNRKFKRDTFLTDSVRTFPKTINEIDKTLLTLLTAGCCEMGEHIYRLDSKTNIWRQISHRWIPVK